MSLNETQSIAKMLSERTKDSWKNPGFKSKAQVRKFANDPELRAIGEAWVNMYGLDYENLPERVGDPEIDGEEPEGGEEDNAKE